MAVDLQSTFLAGALTIGGALACIHGWRLWRRRRLIQDTPTARIRSMAIGLVEVIGAVRGRSLVTAPFSGHECVYWQVDVSVQGRNRGWRVIHRNASGHPFYLDDETGIALVYPRGAECHLNYGVEEVAQGIALPDCYAEYLREHPGAVNGFTRLATLRFRERVLEEGQRLYVLGTATPRASEVVISGGEALAATGTDGPGALHLQRLRERDAQVRGVIRQGDRERTFLLSQESEKQLTFGLGLHAAGLLVGGPLATLAGLWMWMELWGRQTPR